MGPWTFAWICCLQLPYHPRKNGTHRTSFCSTGEHIPTETQRQNRNVFQFGYATAQIANPSPREPSSRLQLYICEPARPLQSSPGPSRPEMPKKSRKCLPGLPAPGPQKISKKSRNTPKTLFGRFPETLRRLAGLSRDFFGDFLGPGDIFETLSAFRARSCKGRAGSQLYIANRNY